MSEEYRTQFELIKLPRPAGYWLLPGHDNGCGTRFSSPKKPNWLVRKMMRILLGFKWEDFK